MGCPVLPRRGIEGGSWHKELSGLGTIELSEPWFSHIVNMQLMVPVG